MDSQESSLRKRPEVAAATKGAWPRFSNPGHKFLVFAVPPFKCVLPEMKTLEEWRRLDGMRRDVSRGMG